MADLILTGVNETLLHQLRERACSHGRRPEEEAKPILAEALGDEGQEAWAQVDVIYRRLAASGRSFSDSAGLLREDRDR